MCSIRLRAQASTSSIGTAPTEEAVTNWHPMSSQVRAAAVIPKGQQVFIDYRRTNDLLMQYYGFVEVDNPLDVYELTGLMDMLQAGQISAVDAGCVDRRL